MMTNFNKDSSQEKILIPLRKLYQKDIQHRKVIAEFANNFKSRSVFLRKEANFLRERLSFYNIDFNAGLLPIKLLTVELVPSTCWFSNVRDHVSQETWDFLRKSTYKKANYQCEVCSSRGKKWPVECHEIWHYDDHNYLQTLLGLTALCPSCHRVKHIGLAALQGHGEQAETHLANTNGWSIEKSKAYLETVWDIWQERSCHSWSLNLSWLNHYGIDVNTKR